MKKKLLAGLLSFTVLTAQMLPVIAADDADVVVSENAVVVEETEEEAGQEAEAEPQVVEEAVDDVEIELGEDDEEIVLGEGEELSYERAVISSAVGEDVVVEEGELAEASVSHIYAKNQKSGTIVADPVVINGTTYNLTGSVTYYGNISYRGRKIKPLEDLNAKASSASLEKLAKDLGVSSTAGLIEAKFTAKKNTKANSGSYFTVKYKVNKTAAKSVGLKGKALKNFNKGLKKLNKAAKKTHIEFNIDPLITNQLIDNEALTPIITVTKSGWGFIIGRKFSHLRARTEYDMPEDTGSSTWEGWKKWKKLSNKEFYKSTEVYNGITYIVLTPKGNNITGDPVYVRKP